MLVTTSRKSSLRTRQFAKELASSIPLAEYSPRGKKPLDAMIEGAKYLGMGNLLIVQDAEGNPSGIACISVSESPWNYAFTAKIAAQKLRGEFGAAAKFKLSSLKLQIKSAKIRKLMKELGILPESDSENLLKEQDSSISFYSSSREIGPKFKVLRIIYGKRT